jgi:hypothetical protein
VHFQEVNLIKHDNCYNYRSWSAVLMMGGELAGMVLENDSPEKYMNSTGRNELSRANRAGYVSRVVSWDERNQYIQDIFEINTSLKIRQGREMSQSYREYPHETSGACLCEAHDSVFIGCFHPSGKMVAYISCNHCGDICASSQILGHGEYLRENIMVHVWAEFVREGIRKGRKYAIYGHWNDGFDGLRAWKTKVGLKGVYLKEI